MNKQYLDTIGAILAQFGGPISVDYDLKNRNLISKKLIDYHKKKYKYINTYTHSDYFSLYALINFVISDLGESEFNLLTGKNLYLDGYPLLNLIKDKI